VRGALLVLVLLGRPVAAQAPTQLPPLQTVVAEPPPAAGCDPREAAELRALLEREASHARKWNIAWASIFGAAAVGTLGVGLANPFPDLQTGLYVSSGKATIGALARLLMPLRVPVPPPNSDPCADVEALRTAVAVTAKRERRNFWINHIGGILVNGGGALIVWKYRNGSQALLSIGIGYPIGLISNYTGPRKVWTYFREHNWTVTVQPQPQQGAWLLTLGGEL
jgi:hypothetical protein